MIFGIVSLALALGATAQRENNRMNNEDPNKDDITQVYAENRYWLENRVAYISPGPCDNDVTAIACRSFKNTADFTVEQQQNDGVDQVYDIKSFLPYNKAYMAVTTDPWDKLKDEDSNRYEFGQNTNGCVFYENRNQREKAVALTGDRMRTGNQHKCFLKKHYGCNTVQSGQRGYEYWVRTGRWRWERRQGVVGGDLGPSERNAQESEDEDHGYIYGWDAKANRWVRDPKEQLEAHWNGKTYRRTINGITGRDGLVHATNRVTLKHLVQSLNTQGAFELYYHRVQKNPIDGVNLKWIAENACKVDMPVSFECTGADCVEVQNIVCASFAGIDARDYGVVSIECKVPPGKFIINSFKKQCKDSRGEWRDNDKGVLDGSTSNQMAGGAQGTRQCPPQHGRQYANANNKFEVTQCGDNAMRLGNGIDFQFGSGANQACTQGTCSITVKSRVPIPENSNIEGCVTIKADVKAMNQMPRKWSEKLNLFHKAEYNLTRESAPEKVISMPIGINFYSDHCDQAAMRNPHPSGDDRTLCRGNGLRDTIAKVASLFGKGIDSVPFLSNQEVNLGKIKKHVHAYFRIVAKVKAPRTWYLERAVTKIEISKDGGRSFEDARYSPKKCSHVDRRDKDKDSTRVAADGYTGGRNTPFHTGAGFPLAYMSCPKMMTSQQAGDIMRFSMAWQLASLVRDASGNGKAELLQDAEEADPNAQSVEVQVTIQLGGGETNITTGTAEGAASADNTVTYIIIAVCVIAAALILAVVVVAFMCLRNRSQEQLVAMSPKQATVAAVYDISAPKKGDVMDV